MRIHSLEHAPQEGAGKIASWARTRGCRLAITRADLGESLPDVSEFDFLVAMGGAMNVYQYRDYPWLAAERKLLACAIAANKAVLGVCLGAQMLADVLGARVIQNPEKEIGWLPIRMLDSAPPFHQFPPECTVFHWHGDTFDLPPNCRRVAESYGCRNQAFICGDRLIGIQFHIEVDAAAVNGFLKGAENELTPSRYVQSAEAIRAGAPDMRATDRALFALLDSVSQSISSPATVPV